MFKLATQPSFIVPVTVILPGSKTRNTFDVEFVRQTAAEIAALQQRIQAENLDDAGLCRELVIGWKGVADEEGELEFSPSQLDRVLSVYPVARCIVETYFASLAGARAGN